MERFEVKTLESKFVQTADVRLHYLEWAGNGPPAVLLHGTGLCAQGWAPIAQALSSRFRVLAMDLRGHGDSDKPQHGYDWYKVAGDLPAFIDALELDNILLVAHSRGGGVAVIGGAQRADRISGAVLIEPNVPYNSPNPSQTPGGRAPNFMEEQARRRRAVWDSREEIYQRYRSVDTFKNWREDALRAYIEGGTRVRNDGRVELKCPPEVEAQFYQVKPPEGMVELVSKITFPVLLMTRAAGGQAPQPSPVILALEKSVLSFRHITVPNAGHFIPQEQPEAVLEATWEFVGATAHSS